MNSSFRAALLGLALLVVFACAQAQPTPDPAATRVAAEMPPGAPSGPPPQLPPGPLTGLGDALRQQGLGVGLVFMNANFHNPSTGITEGQSGNFGQFVFKAGADLERLIGVPNTQLNLIEVWQKPSHRTDSYLFDTGSGFTPFPVVSENHDLANFTLSHRLLDNRLRIEYGRMNLTWDFMLSSMCSGCILSAPAIVLNQPGPSKAVWGGSAIYDLVPGTKLGFGVIEDNPAQWQRTTGWDWKSDTREGWTAIANVTSERGLGQGATPYKMEAGAFHRSSRYNDPLYNSDGSTQADNPFGQPLQHRGTSGVYAQGRRTVWSQPAAGAPENVATYGGLVLAPGAGQQYPVEAYGGVEYGGFLPGNPMAMIGSTFRYLRLGNRRAEYERTARRNFTTQLNGMTAGAVPIVDEDVPRNMFLFDLHGRIGLLPGMFLEAGVQYLKNPNANIAQFTTRRPRDGTMYSLVLIMDLGAMSGLSRLAGPKFY